MSENEITVLAIKGAITELPATDREACLKLADHTRQSVHSVDTVVGTLAFALVGAEMQHTCAATEDSTKG